MYWNERQMETIVKNALQEDLATVGDLTSDNLFARDYKITGRINARQQGVLAGMVVVEETFKQCAPEIVVKQKKTDGAELKPGDNIALIEGPARGILKAERTALNFLQRLSGIATRTRKYVEAVEQFQVRIADTRKTTPTLRMLEKYAVKIGGGHNHRFGLFDAVMIKDNHIAAAGGLTEAVKKLRQEVSHTVKIEVEVENLPQVKEALAVGADIIMLDNMQPQQMIAAVDFIDGRAVVEASGGITINNLQEVARTGVDIISVGALTHQIKSLDIGVDFD